MPSELWTSLRRLFRAPGFLALTAGTLALGLGASTALFSLVNGILLRELPYPEASRLVRVQEVGEKGPSRNMSEANFADLAAGQRTFRAMARYATTVVSAAGGREPVRLRTGYVSRAFFEVFGVTAQRGRGFTIDETRVGGTPVVLVSEGVFRDVLGSPADLANARLTFDGTTFAVVGVLPDGFDQPEGSRVWVAAERLAPLPSRTALNWRAVGRLAPNTSLAAARSDLSGIARRLKAELGDATWMSDVAVTSLRDSIVGRSRSALWLLLGAAVFLLLVAFANVSNLLLARATGRRREIAVRRALGAGRGRLFPEFLGETLGIATVGGVLGLLLAIALLRGLRAGLLASPASVPRLAEVGIDGGALLWAIGLVVSVAIGLAAVLTWWSTDTDAAEALQGARGETESRGKRRTQRAIAAAQIALAMALLGVAGLLGRSVQELLGVDTGFTTRGRALIEVEPPSVGDAASAAAHVRLVEALSERLRAVPGTRAVGAASSAPLSGVQPANGVFLLAVPGEPLDRFEEFARVGRLPGRTGQASYVAATADYFQALDIPLVQGRWFEARDSADAPHVALVSRGLAERTWPGQEALGRQIQFGNMDGDLKLLTVIGVVGDTRHNSLADDATPIVYTHLPQRPAGARTLAFVVATRDGARVSTVLEAARTALREVAPDLPPVTRDYDAVMSAALGDRSFLLRLVSGFALGALLLATAASAGVAAFGVARRRRELGVRLACGAEPAALVRLILHEQLRWLMVSLACGAFATWVVGRMLRAQLWGVEPTDATALVGAAAALAVVVLAATAVPAVRAAATDPVEALRGE